MIDNAWLSCQIIQNVVKAFADVGILLVLRPKAKEHPISTITEATKKSRRLLQRFIITSTLVVASFVACAAVTAIIAVRLLVPIAVTGFVVVASAGVNAIPNALYTGDSETRLTVLTQLKQSFDVQAPQPIDPQLAAWILPAIEQCRTDSDPEVVALAGKLADHINDNTSQPPQ